MPTPLEGLPALAFLFGVGAIAQWCAWRLRLPAILLLLLAGFVAGPVAGLLDPALLFGDAFRPLVSLSVGLILFEGGLSLRFDELRGSGRVVRNLVTTAAAATWALGTLAAVWLAGVPVDIAVLIGAILVLTGPTVVIPLVRHVRPRPPLGPILRWEGILIDPIGALLALLVFEAITRPAGDTLWQIGFDVLRTLVFGGGLGLVGGFVVARASERFVVPDMLQVPVTLGVVAVAFGGANLLQQESGLLAVTVMGITLANRRTFDPAPIADWNEQLTTVLLSMLFLCIAARLPLEQLTRLGWRAVLFTAALVVVVRPVAVWLATLGSALPWRDRAFLMAVAPRGIVVAAVSSEFSLHLEQAGHPDAGAIVALVFPVIVLSVACYGLCAGPIARWLGVAQMDAQGVMIVGANQLGRELGAALRDLGVDVLLVDTNAANAAAARTLGLRTWHGSVLSSRFADEAELAGIGNVLALTPSAEVNRLTLQQFQATFGRARLFRVLTHAGAREEQDPLMPGRLLFRAEASLDWLLQRLHAGARLKVTRLSPQFGPQQYAAAHADAVPLFVLSPEQKLQVVAADQPPLLRPGCTVVALAQPA